MSSSGLEDFPPRRYTEEPLPAYRHVPGYSPHPVNDEAGHSHDRHDHEEGCPLTDARWQDCATYLYGVDLFNQEFFWEAHESWEPLWHAAGHRSGPGLFVQGLIQIAAAFLLARTQRPNAVPRMLERAERNLRRAVAAHLPEGTQTPFGIDLDRWVPAVETYLGATLAGQAPERFPFIELRL